MSMRNNDEIHQLAFELGGTEGGGYLLTPEDLDALIQKIRAGAAIPGQASLAQGPAADHWSQDSPNQPGLYWYWCGDRDAGIYNVQVSPSANGCCVEAGQLGLAKTVDVQELYGWWLANPEPARPTLASLVARQDQRWPILEKPARVGNGVFSQGLSARLVVEEAYWQYQHFTLSAMPVKTNPAVQAQCIPAGNPYSGLRNFANAMINIAFVGGDADGGRIQDLATEFGLLTPQTRQDRCTDATCSCAEHGFPATCYTRAEILSSTDIQSWPHKAALPDNLESHRRSWLSALERLAELEPLVEQGQVDDKSYWQHELNAMREMYADLDRLKANRAPMSAPDSMPVS
jgi:hypothetical protein